MPIIQPILWYKGEPDNVHSEIGPDPVISGTPLYGPVKFNDGIDLDILGKNLLFPSIFPVQIGSLSMYVKPHSFGIAYSFGAENTGYFFIACNADEEGSLVFVETGNSDTGQYNEADFSLIFSDDEIFHFGLAWDGTGATTNDRIKMFKNGINIPMNNDDGGTAWDAKTPVDFKIGGFAAYNVNALVDNVKLYDYAKKNESDWVWDVNNEGLEGGVTHRRLHNIIIN